MKGRNGIQTYIVLKVVLILVVLHVVVVVILIKVLVLERLARKVVDSAGDDLCRMFVSVCELADDASSTYLLLQILAELVINLEFLLDVLELFLLVLAVLEALL